MGVGSFYTCSMRTHTNARTAPASYRQTTSRINKFRAPRCQPANCVLLRAIWWLGPLTWRLMPLENLTANIYSPSLYIPLYLSVRWTLRPTSLLRFLLLISVRGWVSGVPLVLEIATPSKQERDQRPGSQTKQTSSGETGRSGRRKPPGRFKKGLWVFRRGRRKPSNDDCSPSVSAAFPDRFQGSSSAPWDLGENYFAHPRLKLIIRTATPNVDHNRSYIARSGADQSGPGTLVVTGRRTYPRCTFHILHYHYKRSMNSTNS